MNAVTTRRGLLGTFAGMPVAAAFGSVALPALAVPSRLGWNAALRDYQAKKAYSDALSMDDEDASDAAIDAYCNSMEHLAVDVRAPDMDALAYKIELTRDRWQYVGAPEEWLNALLADVRHLTGRAVHHG